MTQPESADLASVQAAKTRVQRLARLFDEAFAIPGTRIRLGLDALLGLIPGIGDIAGLLLSGVILVEALRVGAPRALWLRMLGIAAADALLGLVPLLGDVADVAFRANRRNAALLLEHLETQERALTGTTKLSSARAWLLLAGMAVVAIAIVLLLRAVS
ncbi:MAG: DUF4112 domain-containing protein [Burkholderiales bacterium]